MKLKNRAGRTIEVAPGHEDRYLSQGWTKVAPAKKTTAKKSSNS